MTIDGKTPVRNSRVIYDVLYGFIPITEWEEKIIDSPFYQRLRWVKQLGFSNYIFPCAEHNRFSHAIGVMHSMDCMIRNLGINAPDAELFDPKCTNERALLHKSLRIAALLHDIGTFPFSHAVEYAYIRHGNASRKDQGKDLPNSHEHLGSYIIKNTDFDGGLTRILSDYNLDVGLISKIIKGESPHLIANQLIHSDLDADRMDYLMRDAHYTGIKYGQFDRDYILANLTTFDAGKGQVGFGVRESATFAVEDFLIARFNWYSQVIKHQESAKFDVMATYMAKAFLEKDQFYQFQDLLDFIESRDHRFFFWNDMYFMTRSQELLLQNKIKDPRVKELTEMLLFRRAPKSIKHPLFEHRLIEFDGDESERQKNVKKIQELIQRFQSTIDKKGNGTEWILSEVPEKDVTFTKGIRHLVKSRSSENLHSERDPLRVVDKKGNPKLLVEKSTTLIHRIAPFVHFAPNVYGNDSAIGLLRQEGLIE